jgi:hypothetical protein
MANSVKIALLTLAFGGAIAVCQPAAADSVTVSTTTNGVAFGYSDGYWDRAHTWHAWRDANEANAWRAANHDHYYEWKHDRDADQGWHEDHWWDRH